MAVIIITGTIGAVIGFVAGALVYRNNAKGAESAITAAKNAVSGLKKNG